MDIDLTKIATILENPTDENALYYLKSKLTNKSQCSLFINYLINNQRLINGENIHTIILLVHDIMINDGIVIQESYPFLLSLIFEEHSCNVSISYKYVEVLLAIKGDINMVFEDIFTKASHENVSNVLVSLFCLYGLPEKINDELISNYSREVILKCASKNKSSQILEQAVALYLKPLIKDYSLLKQLDEIFYKNG